MPGHGQVSGPVESGKRDPARDDALGDGKDPTPAGGDGASGDASSEESGYRRDDYWRKSQQELPADAESEPAHGQSFETPEERAKADDGPADDGAGPGDDDSGRTDDEPEHSPPHAG